MDRDRWTQLVALIVLASCLVGSAALVPAINTMRRKEQISVKTELGKGTPPKYVIAATAAGSFRGLAANILWYRCEMLKREGKFFEAYALADWICTLQPRFPHVWSFHAWNMAYNISVETSTPEERWHWVNRGIRLLREEGIPNNPDAVRLYRELGWILFHKVGQFSDDMHWYYKREMAREWQEVLGDFGRVPEGIALPSDGEKIKLPSRREIFAEHLRPIVAMADTYIAFHRPTEDMRKLIEEIGRLDPDRRDELARFLTMNMETLRDELTEYEKKLNEDQRQLRAEVSDLEKLIDQQIDRALNHSGSDAFFADHPDAREVYDRLLAAAGTVESDESETPAFALDRLSLRRIGRVIMLRDYLAPGYLRAMLELSGDEENAINPSSIGLMPEDRGLLEVINSLEDSSGLEDLLHFWRAKVLLEDYNMDPVYMLYLTEKFGPLDWRLPASHAIYWNLLGVERSGLLIDRTKYDIINTDRGVIHGLQDCMKRGRIHFDPLSNYLNITPEVGFIPAYETAMEEAMERYRKNQEKYTGDPVATTDTFENGHENCLIKAVEYHYYYGDEEEARRYFRKVKRLYANKSDIRGRYDKALEQFVLDEGLRDMQSDVIIGYAVGMISRGLIEGLANSEFDTFNRYIATARRAYDKYNKEKGFGNANAPQERLQFGSFDEMFTTVYVETMTSQRYSINARQRIYSNTPQAWRRGLWPLFRAELYAELEAKGVPDPQNAFPPPQGVDQAQPPPMIEKPQTGTVERN